MKLFSNPLALLGKESVIYGVSNVLSRGLTYLLLPVYARILTVDDYGVIDLLTVLGAVVTVVMSFGMDDAEARYWYDTNDDADQRRTLSTALAFRSLIALAVAGLTSLAGVVTGPALVPHPDSRMLFLLLGVSFVFDPHIGMMGNQLRRLRRPFAYLQYSILVLFLTMVATMVSVTVLKRGARGYMEALLVSKGFSAVVAWCWIPSWTGGRLSFARLRELLSYGIPLIPAAFALWVVNGADRFFLEHYRNVAEVGTYGMAQRVAAFVGLATTAFGLAWSPFALSVFRDKDAGRLYSDGLRIYSVLTLAFALLAALFSKEILRILAGPGFQEALAAVPLLLAARSLNGVYYIAATGLTLAKKSGLISWAVGAGSVLAVGLNWILTPRYGLHGAAVAAVAAQAAMTVCLFGLSQRHWPIPYRWAPPLGACALAVAAATGGLLPEAARGAWGFWWRAAAFVLYCGAVVVLGLLKFDRRPEASPA
jgi:O-antigen/teichoic acid export membrane protein